MNGKSKIYISIIAILLVIVLAKPVMNSDLFSGKNTEEIEISFFEYSVEHLRLLESMKKEGCISKFEYDVYEKNAKVYLTAGQKEKAKEYVVKNAEKIIAQTPDYYDIEVNAKMDNVLVLADCDMDLVEVLKGFSGVVESCEMYQKFDGEASWSCHGVIKNRETGVVISETVQPGASINYKATDITGIDDEELAVETSNHNMFTSIDYQEAVIGDGVFTSLSGGFQLDLPDNANVTSKDELNKNDELPVDYTLYDVKSRLYGGMPIHELELKIDNNVKVLVELNYSTRQYDEGYYDQFINRILYTKLQQSNPDAKLSKTRFLGEDCNLITYKEGDIYSYMVFYCKDDFSYCIWGQYQNPEDEEKAKELISSFRKISE